MSQKASIPAGLTISGGPRVFAVDRARTQNPGRRHIVRFPLSVTCILLAPIFRLKVPALVLRHFIHPSHAGSRIDIKCLAITARVGAPTVPPKKCPYKTSYKKVQKHRPSRVIENFSCLVRSLTRSRPSSKRRCLFVPFVLRFKDRN